MILNAAISGASERPRKRNWAGTIAATGVGVGVGVGVGEMVGVGVGEGLWFTIRRGEITQPAMIKSSTKMEASSADHFDGEQRYRTL